MTHIQRTVRCAAQGRGFRAAAYAVCNPAWHEHQARLQRYNQARRRRLSPAEAQRIKQLHKRGQTLEQIGAALRINRNIVTRELREHGIVLTRRMTLLAAEVEHIQTMLKEGRKMTFIAEEIRVCATVIRRELRAQGIPTRPERRRDRARG